MNSERRNRPQVKLYERLIYWPITLFVLLLAFPLLIIIFLRYLIRSTGAPLKSVKNLIGFILTLMLVTGGFLAYEVFSSYDIGQNRHSLMVEEDDLFPKISSNLAHQEIIESEFLFKVAAVLTGTDRSIAAGRYDFAGEISLYDVLMKLKHQEVATAFLTIPEGSNVYKIGSILTSKLEIDSSMFVNLALDTAYTIRQFRLEGLEGYLFPESYRFRYGIKADKVMETLVREYYKRTSLLFDSLHNSKLTPKEILILASIIEAEATHDDEMAVISSVYHNRLRKKMPLQADPTVLYALKQPSRGVLYSDLKIDSPYNTYRVRGLPPGPINSPGLTAIRAALNPAQTDYLYFVADGTGRHIFSKSLDEHNRAKKRVKELLIDLKKG